MEPRKKPPIGLMPLREWRHLRLCDIVEAMERYAGCGNAVPLGWVVELKELLINQAGDIREELQRTPQEVEEL